MEMSGLLNDIALFLENTVRLQKGEFRLGMLGLESLTEIAPLNQRFEALILCCKECGKTTAFLALKSIEQFLDLQKKSTIQCRHCHFEVQIPETRRIREMQGKIYDFLQLQDWTFAKILIRKGILLQFSVLDRRITFQNPENSEEKPIQIEVPQNKLKLLQGLQIGQKYRFKSKVFSSTILSPQKAFLKKSSQKLESEQIQRYELLSLTKIKP
ncbi:MAG: hypothetical protein LUQ65_12040 [Candidatus Helarchaeota archaeon]|nr:hypothetical protein [Candidatus Helarchaeota archaeon]